jgi:hypothetical protein
MLRCLDLKLANFPKQKNLVVKVRRNKKVNEKVNMGHLVNARGFRLG